MTNPKIINKILVYSKIWKPNNLQDYDKACEYIYIFAKAYQTKVKKKSVKYSKHTQFQCINVWFKNELQLIKTSNVKSDMHQLFIAPNNLGIQLYTDSNYTENKFLDTNKMFDNEDFDIFYDECYNKGILARSIFYIVTIYYKEFLSNDNNFWNNLETLKRWNVSYPPGKFEIMRNYRIKNIQGNVNPYIINHHMIDNIFS